MGLKKKDVKGSDVPSLNFMSWPERCGQKVIPPFGLGLMGTGKAARSHTNATRKPMHMVSN